MVATQNLSEFKRSLRFGFSHCQLIWINHSVSDSTHTYCLTTIYITYCFMEHIIYLFLFSIDTLKVMLCKHKEVTTTVSFIKLATSKLANNVKQLLFIP